MASVGSPIEGRAFEHDALIVLSELRTAGNRVIVRVDWSGIGRGPQSDMEMTKAFTVRKELIFGPEYFWDHGEVLEAAGLSEQGTHFASAAERASEGRIVRFKAYLDRDEALQAAGLPE